MGMKLNKKLSKLSIKSLNSLQKHVIPLLTSNLHSNQHNDLIVISPTGSGKTLTYLLPILDNIENHKVKNSLQFLILAPTRELCLQIKNVVQQFTNDVSLMIGGLPFTKSKSIVVGTPGRVLEQLMNGQIRTELMNTLIIDEFDRMMEMGFMENLKCVFEYFGECRKFMFSATLPSDFINTQLEENTIKVDVKDDIKVESNILVNNIEEKKPINTIKVDIKDDNSINNIENKIIEENEIVDIKSTDVVLKNSLAFLKLKNPKLIKHTISSKTEHFYIKCNNHNKLEYLYSLLKSNKTVVVFMSTCKQVKFYYRLFSKFYKNTYLLVSKMSQNRRISQFNNFNEKGGILFCTDLGSRGLDFDINCVVQFEIPNSLDDYIHRAGRSGRRFKPGQVNRSIIFLLESEIKFINTLYKINNIKLEEMNLKNHKVQKKVKSILRKNKEIREIGCRFIETYKNSLDLLRNRYDYNVNEIIAEIKDYFGYKE